MKVPRIAQRAGDKRSQGREINEEALASWTPSIDRLCGGTLVSSSLRTLGKTALTRFVRRILVTRALNARGAFLLIGLDFPELLPCEPFVLILSPPFGQHCM
jgi:hypothetical protein